MSSTPSSIPFAQLVAGSGEGDSLTVAPPTYVDVTTSESVTYLVRSDGIVDRIGNFDFGKVGKQFVPRKKGTKYVGASAGNYASYLLRDDGVA